MTPIENEGRNRYAVELALDRGVCYPMEEVTLTVRVTAASPVRQLLCVHLPQNVEVENVSMQGVDDNFLNVYSKEYDGKLIVIPFGKYLSLGARADVNIRMRLHTIKMNHMLSFCAWTDDDMPGNDSAFFAEPKNSRSIEVAVKSSASYLRFLPEVYNYDDFVNRFLMMFESFWKPINLQISQVENYFDPDFTPDSFLNWLASWVGMEIDDTFPKDRIRELIKSAIPFHHSRGTASSLQMFLELYSGGKVTVSERKAQNMILGGKMGIGDSMALGTDNKPNTVVVEMAVPKAELERTGFTKDKYKKKINQFVRAIVPAHTVFTVECKFE